MVEIQRGQARHGLPTLLSGGQVPYDLLTPFLRERCGRMPDASHTLWSCGRGGRFPTTPLTSFAGWAGTLRPSQPLGYRDRCSLPSPAGRCKAPARTRIVARVYGAVSPARGGLQRPPDPDWNVAGCKSCRALVAPEATVAWRQLLEKPAGPCLMRDRSRTMTARSRQSKKHCLDLSTTVTAVASPKLAGRVRRPSQAAKAVIL